MRNLKEILRKLTIYNPQAITAFMVFLQGPRNILRRFTIFSFNSLYYSGKLLKKWRHRNDLIAGNITGKLNFPKVQQATAHHTVVIIAELSIPQCKTYRVDSKKEILESLGYKVYVTAWQNQVESIKYLQLSDFVIFYRVPFCESVKNLYQEADRLHLKKFYDIDDLVFDIQLYGKYLNQSKINLEKERKELLNGAKLYRQAILHADVFLTSTKAIKNVYDDLKLQTSSYIIPNGLTKEVLNIHKLDRKRPKSDRIQIFYGAGSKTHDADFDLISRPVANILRDFKNVDLYIIGQLELSPIFNEFKEQVHRISRLSTENYFREISQYDIALMPLTNNFFNECKSNIKYIEASALNIPSVASNIYEFSHVIEDGENGFVASTEKEWYEKIKQLINNPSLRKTMAQKAFLNCELRYGKDQQKTLLDSILKKELKETCNVSKKLTVLQVNLYYGLNSFGGATIVVENLAEEMVKLPKEQIAVSVFTTHSGDPAGIGTLRKYEFKGIPVYSCSAQIMEGTKIDDSVVNQNFCDVIQTVKPDIVHFHAVQGFGYGLSKICKEQNIPYVMTLHDSWAFCPKLFMVDEKGEHCTKYGTSVDVCEKQCHFNADWIATRRNDLYKMLQGASQLYVPSYYAKKELEKLLPNFQFLVNKNGIEEFKGKHEVTKREKIRFLFVAGEERVKGFDLVHQVLMELLDYEWELVLLMPSGTPKAEWPQGRVKVLGKQNRDEMQKIYQEIDVLLFPSLGYESFGLTVREAISSDCFVIVSNCGGPAEAVHNNKNGFIIPRGEKAALKTAVEKVLKNPAQYLNYRTKDFGDVRSYKEQAEELLGYYTKFL